MRQFPIPDANYVDPHRNEAKNNLSMRQVS